MATFLGENLRRSAENVDQGNYSLALQQITAALRQLTRETCGYDLLIQPDMREHQANATAIAALPELLAVALEIAQSHCDLGDSERRIRLYHALMQAGVPEYQPIGGVK